MDKGLIWCLFALSTVVIATTTSAAVTHDVGDANAWGIPNEPTFYTTWAANKTFNIGDKLVFKWVGTHNVAEVTEDEFGKCSSTAKVHDTSPVTISLDADGTKYFICTVGSHCMAGQKLSVTVGSQTPTTPSTPKSSAPAPLTLTALSAALFTVAIVFFTSI